MKMIFVVLSLISLSAFANYPTIDIDGTTYHLADSDDASGEWFETMDGYCVRTGQGVYGSGISTIENVGPIVRLDAQGNVVERFADNRNDQIWVVTDISCGS